MTFDEPLLTTRFLAVKLASAAYVVALVLSHGVLPHVWVWELALFFLIAMLFTYPLAAWAQGAHERLELSISLGLAALGIIGYLTTPLLIIAGIIGHGFWDVIKHRGAGARFFGWYVSGCFVVDFAYGAALLLYWLWGGG